VFPSHTILNLSSGSASYCYGSRGIIKIYYITSREGLCHYVFSLSGRSNLTGCQHVFGKNPEAAPIGNWLVLMHFWIDHIELVDFTT
jgi:hypothetical protein